MRLELVETECKTNLKSVPNCVDELSFSIFFNKPIQMDI